MYGTLFTDMSISLHDAVAARNTVRDPFYAAFRAAAQEANLPPIGYRADKIMDRAERVLHDALLPGLKTQGANAPAALAAIPAATLVQAVYASAAQENTGFFGKTKRAAANFAPMQRAATTSAGRPLDIAPTLLQHPATTAWVAMTKRHMAAILSF